MSVTATMYYVIRLLLLKHSYKSRILLYSWLSSFSNSFAIGLQLIILYNILFILDQSAHYFLRKLIDCLKIVRNVVTIRLPRAQMTPSQRCKTIIENF